MVYLIKNIKSKKGAIELSISTIVIIVLAMSMLILGVVLVRSIFTGAKYNVDTLNKNVEAEINKLFNERGGKTFVYLPNNELELKKGTSYGVALGVKNTAQGEPNAGNFKIQIKAASVENKCQSILSLSQADAYIKLIASPDFALLPGTDPHYSLVKLEAPETAPLCEISYNVIVTKDGQAYDTNFFIAKIA